MSRRSWWLLLAAVVCAVASFQSVRAADEVRSGEKFNRAASPVRKFVRRSVDSTGTVAGALDSAILIQPSVHMPVPVTIGGVYLSDTSSRALTTDASGNAKMVDADRDRDLVLGQNSIINSTVTSFSADSSIAFPVGNARHITVWLKITPAAATATSRVAVQFRLHLSSAADSNSVAPWTSRFGLNVLNSGAGPDSVGDIATPSGDPARPYSDETLIIRSTMREGGSGGAPGVYNWNSMVPLTYEIAPGSGRYFSVRVRNAGLSSIKIVAHYTASAL